MFHISLRYQVKCDLRDSDLTMREP